MLYKLLKRLAIALYHRMCIYLPVKENRIVFDSSLGRSYSGNPRAVLEYMVTNNYHKKWECVWFYAKTPHPVPKEVKQVKFGGLKYLYYMATAKAWVFDCRQPEWIVKRPGVIYVQTWHGTPLKKLGLDMTDVFMSNEESLEVYQEKFVQNVKRWDCLVSQNRFSTVTFRKAFEYYKDWLEVGYPRNDLFFAKDKDYRCRELKKKMNLPSGKKVILYAPTFRDDEFHKNACYDFHPAMDFDRMKKELGKNAILLVKYHYLVMEKIDWTPYKGFVYAFDAQYDISELMLVSDVLITDYSSVMFDFSIMRKPMFLFAYDLEKYRGKLRGFYMDYEKEMPGPIVENTEDLIQAIKTYKAEQYKERYDRFCRRYTPWDKGTASRKVTRYIEKRIEEPEENEVS